MYGMCMYEENEGNSEGTWPQRCSCWNEGTGEKKRRKMELDIKTDIPHQRILPRGPDEDMD